MLEVGVFHNGASDLPVLHTPSGIAVNDGTLAEVHASSAADGAQPDSPGHPRGSTGLQLLLHDRASLSARGRRVQPQSAAGGDGGRRTHHAHPPRPGGQHPALASPDSDRGAGRHARRDQRRPRGVRHRPRLPAARSRDLGLAVRLDHPGPRAQPRRTIEEAYDLIIKAWTSRRSRTRASSSPFRPSSPRWNHQQTIAYFSMDKVERQVEEIAEAGRTGSLRRCESGAAIVDGTQRAAGVSATAAEAAPAGVGAAHLSTVDPVGGAAWGQRLLHRRAQLAAAQEHRHVLRRSREARLARPPQSRPLQVRLGCREAARHRDLSLHPPRLAGAKQGSRAAALQAAMELQWDYYGPFGFTAVLAESGRTAG